MARYDLQRLLDFINSETSPKRRSKMTPEQIEAARQAAAEALMDFLADYCDVRAELGLKRKRGGRGKIIDPNLITLNHPAMAIAVHLEAKRITREQAITEIEKLNLPISSRRAIETLLKGLKPRAQEIFRSEPKFPAPAK